VFLVSDLGFVLWWLDARAFGYLGFAADVFLSFRRLFWFFDDVLSMQYALTPTPTPPQFAFASRSMFSFI
jgi:hypothetical protein